MLIKEYIKKLRYVVIVLIVTLVSGELLIRGYDYVKGVDGIITHNAHQEPLFRDHSYLNFILSPKSRFRWDINDPKTIEINSLGFRYKEFNPIKEKGVFRIFTIGGSSTFDPFAKNNESTWPAKLEKLLLYRFQGKKIEVINAGVPAYSSYEYTASVLFRILNYNPDLIIIFETINDAIIIGHVTPYKDIGDIRGNIYRGNLLRRALNHSVLFDFLYYQLYNGAMRHPASRWKTDQKDLNFIEFGVNAFRINLTAIVAACKASNVNLLFSTAPIWEEKINWTSKSRAIMSPIISRCREVIYSICVNNNIDLVDNANLINKTDKYLKNESHLTSAGGGSTGRKFS